MSNTVLSKLLSFIGVILLVAGALSAAYINSTVSEIDKTAGLIGSVLIFLSTASSALMFIAISRILTMTNSIFQTKTDTTTLLKEHSPARTAWTDPENADVSINWKTCKVCGVQIPDSNVSGVCMNCSLKSATE